MDLAIRRRNQRNLGEAPPSLDQRAVLDVVLHRLDDDNGIIDDDADGQHQAEKR